MSSTVIPVSRGEQLHRRIEWCVGLAAALPPCETKSALEELARECVRDLLEEQHGGALIELVKTKCASQQDLMWPIAARKTTMKIKATRPTKRMPVKFPSLWHGLSPSAASRRA